MDARETFEIVEANVTAARARASSTGAPARTPGSCRFDAPRSSLPWPGGPARPLIGSSQRSPDGGSLRRRKPCRAAVDMTAVPASSQGPSSSASRSRNACCGAPRPALGPHRDLGPGCPDDADRPGGSTFGVGSRHRSSTVSGVARRASSPMSWPSSSSGSLASSITPRLFARSSSD